VQVTKITAQVRYSQDTGKGAWKSMELGAEATISPGESWRVAQANLYRDLGHQLKVLWKQSGSAAPQDATVESPIGDSTDAQHPSNLPLDHFCQTHGVPFVAREGRYGEFWSHQIAGSQTWCNESRAEEVKR
jgi:hypothetical protein